MINEVNVPQIIHLLYLGHVKILLSKNISEIIKMIDANNFMLILQTWQPFRRTLYVSSSSNSA